MNKELKRNGSGYSDPTAYNAMKNFVGGVASMSVYRGDIFYVTGNGGMVVGSEQKQDRPAIIVSNNKNNEHSSVVEVVWLTSAPKAKPLPTHVTVQCEIPSVALCEQVHSVSKNRLGDYVTTCTDEEMEAIDKALMISLGLKRAVDENSMIDELKTQLEFMQKELKRTDELLEASQAKGELMAGDLEEIKKENERLKAKTPKEEIVKLTAERDLYKSLYETIFERMIAR